MADNNLTEKTVSLFESGNRPGTPSKEEIDENIYTMGAQAYYNETMSRLTNNRHIAIDESILEKIDQTSQKIASKYGYESKEYRKFLEKIREYDNNAAEVTRLTKANKRRALYIKLLAVVVCIAVAVGVVFVLNSDTFYSNQGEYNHIYKRDIFGNTELFKAVSSSSIAKDGGKLYYINTADNYIYSISAKTSREERQIGANCAAHFELMGDYIYYINMDDGNKLYKMDKKGRGDKCVYDGACLNISDDGKNIRIIPEENPESHLIYNTKKDKFNNSLVK